MIVEEIVPSIRSSSTPVTVTFCGVSQFADVKVSELVAVASPVSEEAIVNTTSVDGCTLRTIENKSVDPSSPTIVDPLVSTTVKPTESSSVVSIPTF